MGDPPEKHNSYIPQFSQDDDSAINLEIQKLLATGVIIKCEHETGEYISPILKKNKIRRFMQTHAKSEKPK